MSGELAPRASKWYKVDLQVATPGGGFRMPDAYDYETAEGMQEAARNYIDIVRGAGLDVIALADHNSGVWVDCIKEAARETDLTVFPGVEVTSGSGQDGIHIVLIGNEDITSADIDRLLYSVCGFNTSDHRTHSVSGEPLPSPRSLFDILDDLPDEYLALAPHAFGENGIACMDSIKKQVRWKSLHHDRIAAIDVGSISGGGENRESWRTKFRLRQLSDFPCLKRVAFMSTSDAYDPDGLGEKFTWVRMQKPTFEALRQATLDFGSRIICPWENRAGMPSNPNKVTHPWIQAISINNALGNSKDAIYVELDPHLNVIIGGRGSGKSTVVGSMRLLYSQNQNLPKNIKDELDEFDSEIYAECSIRGVHYLPISQERQEAAWSRNEGSHTERGAGEPITPTQFQAQVISQKELYERARSTRDDPTAASASLISLIDQERTLSYRFEGGEDLMTELNIRRNKWIGAAKELLQARERLSALPVVTARIGETKRILSAWDSPESVSRRERNDAVAASQAKLRLDEERVSAAVPALEVEREALAELNPGCTGSELQVEDERSKLASAETALSQLMIAVVGVLDRTLADIRECIAGYNSDPRVSEWRALVGGSEEDQVAYRAELLASGVSEATYDEKRTSLREDEVLLRTLEEIQRRVPSLEASELTAWDSLMEWHRTRLDVRRREFQGVAERSGVLRFEVEALGDTPSWTRSVRMLLGLRSDAYLTDVPNTANAIFSTTLSGGGQAEVTEQMRQWRYGLMNGDLQWLSGVNDIRSQWVSRLEALDLDVRLRLAVELPEDFAEMRFLRAGKNSTEFDAWQAVSAGSPGQRTAAMLALVLHLGGEPLVLDQPEDDLDTQLLSELVVSELRESRWQRQVIVVTHNANIPVNGDADRVIVLENNQGSIRLRSCGEPGCTQHSAPIEAPCVRRDIQDIMEGGVDSFIKRERKYNNELSSYRAALLVSPG